MTAREPEQLFDGEFSRDHQIAQLRVPPHSIEAESSVLGGLLLDNGTWDRIGDLLAEGDFYRHEHRLVFAAIGALVNANKPADIFTVLDALEKTGKASEAGGLAYLNALAQYVASPGNIRRYAEIVRERSVLRRLISASDEIATAAFNTAGRPIADILDEAERKICTIGQNEVAAAEDWEGMETGIVRLLDRIQTQADGKEEDFTPTGLSDLDERLDGGMRDGEVIVIGARPSMGKSALALTIAVNVASRPKKAKPVGVFSMEMPRPQLHNRAMSMVGKIHLSRIKRPERLHDYDWPSITEGVDKLRHIPLFINDQSGLNINQIRAKARALRRKQGKLGCIVIDYLGLMAGTDPKMPRVYQIEEITKGLKSLAKELGSPILLLVQLNRKVEERVDQMPMLSDLRDSGSIEQDADIVIFVHRPIKAKPDLGEEWKQYAKLSLAKVRDGEPGYLDLWYVGENTHFTDWPTDQTVPSSKVRTGGKAL